ncbi:MAG TPA: hypothetical protein VJT73_17400 [Polyangiaceae bacterium]|nr:hypothetical protein [Polyangiaceae bacterium]
MALLALVTGCGSESYAYRPAEQATATLSGLPAARYGVPPERPSGTVRVASPGLTEIGVNDGQRAKMLLLRVNVENNSDEEPWSFDTREQRVVVAGDGESRPAYVASAQKESPLFRIARGEKRTIDLYYPPPAGFADAKRPPSFDIIWQVKTGERVVAERTPFDSVAAEPANGVAPPNRFGTGWGLGPYWWYDPLWPGPTYVIAPGNPPLPVPLVAPPVHRPGG